MGAQQVTSFSESSEDRDSLHAIEVARAVHELLLFSGERRQAITELLAHASRVVAVAVNGVGEPRAPPLLSALSGGDVC